MENLIDIITILHEGDRSFNEVLYSISELGANEIIKVISPFVPVPLIDRSNSMGYQHWIHKKSPGEIWVYFCR